MKYFFFFLLFSLCSSLWAQTSYVAPTTVLSKGAYQFGIMGDYFITSKRLNREGQAVGFNDGESFNRMQAEFSGFYGLAESLQIGGGVRFRQNSSKTMNPLTGLVESESSSGVQSTFVSLVYAFRPVNQMRYALEGNFRYVPYTNELVAAGTQANLVLGDEGNEYSGGLAATYLFKGNNSLTGRVGYRMPGTDLSSEIYWQIEGALIWTNFSLIAGVDGNYSMGNDPYKDDLANKAPFNTGSSALYNSTNREWITPYLGANVAFGKNWRVEFRGSQVLNGKSTDLGNSFSLSLIRRVDDKKARRVDRKFKEYDFEASVTKVSPKKGFVLIDKGLTSDVRKGMKIDFFEFDYVGGNILLARGTVLKSKSSVAVVKITHRYNTKKPLKAGAVARGSFR